MEDEAAEIELLEQHLNKTTQISQRMTSILSKFDTRLVKLEKSILPLHNSTQSLTRLVQNIESTLQSIDKVVSNHEGIAAEEALILRGPQPSDLTAYIDAIERLNANIAFKATDRSMRDNARLVETGAKKLAHLYTKLVAEASAAPPVQPMAYLPSSPPTISSALLTTLQPLVTALRSLPLPATHPSNPASSGILNALKEAQGGYAEMRSGWAKKCLDGDARRVAELVGAESNSAEGGKKVGMWVEALLNLAEVEYGHLLNLGLLLSPQLLATTYTSFITPLLTLFTSTVSNVQSLIKSSLSKHVFLALSAYSSLVALQPRWDDVMRQRAGRRDNELAEALHSMRGVCLRSFPEFLADVKLAEVLPLAPGGKPIEIGTGVTDITNTVVDYLTQLPGVQDAVGATLLILGDGNWRMGAGGASITKSAPGEDEEKVLVEHFTFDVINALLRTLSTLSKTHRRPALSSIFLLNNIAHLRQHLLVAPRTPIDDLLSEPTQTALNSGLRSAKAGYFESVFGPLVTVFSEDKEKSGLGSGKQSTKERFLRFFASLEEVAETHRFAKVLEEDEAGRKKLGEEMVRFVVPVFKVFVEKHRAKDFSKNPSKYIKATPDEVERQIRALFK
ncbi:hypothetical protein BOTBODRAFT_153680 [Botryobasidium botryosum FD-172 SS1]|uniref:Exocyst complex protein EXO70 n=1 Tax=Botryobasidium botryosum (strain FD-172 SS1) TaxID=930990 RepID=A0A067N3U3_BOTB1|nr:hypothetical protein BOTBODRAFT_153680 [Botryobasidium botryosum FD-172 SS1]